jgi:hypothetical protein
MQYFELNDQYSEDGHEFASYDLLPGDDIDAALAALVRDLYIEPETLIRQLRAASANLDGVCDEVAVRRAVDLVAEACIPQKDGETSQPEQLHVTRSEVAEILALAAMDEIHQILVPAPRVRNKEISSAPARGLDVLGIDASGLLAITEVKASSEQKSPPRVVHSNNDSMWHATKARLEPAAIIQELNWALKHAKGKDKDVVAQTLLLYCSEEPPSPIIAPVLVRPIEAYGSNDYGKFKSHSNEWNPSKVKFLLIRIAETLEEFSSRVYAHASEPPR